MQRLIIQRALCDVVAAGLFYAVTYTPGNGKPVLYDPNTEQSIQPASVRVNEISERFKEDAEYGQDQILMPANWTFVLFLEWDNREIDLSFFEALCMAHPPFIQGTANYRSVRLFLINKEVNHPVEQQGSTGTQVKYLFQAELGRL